MMLKSENFEVCTTEIFGPFQIIVDYKDAELDMVLELLERMHANLTAAVVSNDVVFQHKVLGNTVNGTTYCGIRARTTGFADTIRDDSIIVIYYIYAHLCLISRFLSCFCNYA